MTASIPSSVLILDRLAELNSMPSAHLSSAQCQRLIKRFGTQSSAYFNMQEGALRFGMEDVGFVAYLPLRTLMGLVNVVFTNPVCDPSTQPVLLRRFLDELPGRKMFVGIDADVARDLRAIGFKINEMGTEFSIRIEDFNVEGKHKKQLRHAANLGKRCGIDVREQRWHDVDQKAVQNISDQWRSHKAVSNNELRLLTRPPVFNEEWGVRKFYAYDKTGKMLAYVFFDPFYQGGKVVGYTANILRQDKGDVPAGLLDFVILEAMEIFRAEGIELLSLGISPLYNIEAMPGDRAGLRKVCQTLYEKGNKFYAFKALAYHKTRYRCEESKWYMATDDISVMKICWTMLRGTGVMGQARLQPWGNCCPLPEKPGGHLQVTG